MPDNERKISIPLIAKDQESSRLPFVINVICQYWGEEIPISNHAPAGTAGPSMIDGIEIAEAHGLAAFIYRSSVEDLRKRIDQSIPVVAILPGILNALQHAVIASGYTISERRIFLYVPEPDTIGAVPEARFDSEWAQDDRMAIILVPSDMTNLISREKLELVASNRLYLEAERLWRQAKISEAEAKLRLAVDRDPSNVQAWAMLGSIYNEKGSAEAPALYERALTINPKYFLAHRGLGNYYFKTKQYARAFSSYAAAIEINPVRNPAIFKNRALASIELGDNPSAKHDLQRYIDALPNAPDSSAILEAIKDLK